MRVDVRFCTGEAVGSYGVANAAAGDAARAAGASPTRRPDQNLALGEVEDHVIRKEGFA